MTEEQQVWACVKKLWDMAYEPQFNEIAPHLHPNFSGWVIGTNHIQDFEEAVNSVAKSSVKMLDYHLTPHKITICEGTTAIVHYSYRATMDFGADDVHRITGKWTEIYCRKQDQWVMCGVSGGPDGQR